MNVLSLSGRVAQDIKLIETSNDSHVITINLAVKSDYYKEGEEPKTDFIPVTVWGKLAENCAAHLVKGQLIEIEGRLQRRSYEKDGERCYVTDAIAEKVHFLSKPARKEEASDDRGSKKSKAKKSA
jgi:single-strand DNA-binding protein